MGRRLITWLLVLTFGTSVAPSEPAAIMSGALVVRPAPPEVVTEL